MPIGRTILIIALAMQMKTAFAATDGLLGSESEATTVISFIKQNSVRISGLDDINLGTRASLTTSEQYTENICVYSSTGAYAVTATSANGAFELRSENGPDTILYRLQWVSGNAQDLVPAVSVGGFIGDVSDIDCAGSQNASIRIIVSKTSFNSADPGIYSDTLVLLVRAE
ncbi:MAG: hypothetical protein AB8B64_16510 [Granulosicoccus sp.]